MDDVDVHQDDQYYFPDGNVTILVSKTLFKVHGCILSRDGSAFADMFALDKQGSVVATPSFVQDGDDDEHPIELQGDTEQQFRDLLWSLYALPHEIVEITSPKTQNHILKLVNIATIAHKYHYSATKSWALRALQAFFISYPPPPVFLSTDTLTKVTEVAVLCQDGDGKANTLITSLRSKWADLITARQDIGLILTVLERLGIRDLCGYAYVAMLLQGRASWEKDIYLTQAHRIRLLSGYYNLSKLTEMLPDVAPVFGHHPQCIYGPDVCNQAWRNFWRSLLTLDPNVVFLPVIPRPDQLDIMARLTLAEDFMKLILREREVVPNRRRHPFEEAVNCHDAAFTSVAAYYSKTRNELMDIFHDPI